MEQFSTEEFCLPVRCTQTGIRILFTLLRAQTL